MASAQNVSQTETSINTQFFRVLTRVVSPRQNIQDPQPYLDTSPRRNITFNFHDEVQGETQNTTSIRNTSVNVSSPPRSVSNNTRNITRLRYDPPSIPSAFQQSNTTSQPENNSNNNQQTSSRYYDPFKYSFFPSTNTNIHTNSNQTLPQYNNNLMPHLLRIFVTDESLTKRFSSAKSKNILLKQCTIYSKKISKPSTFSTFY